MTKELDEKEVRKAELKARGEAMEKKEKELNAGRTGKGTRIAVGMTRGKNPQEVQYEALDESQPDTLPKTISEWLAMFKDTPHAEESAIVSYIIDGFNSASYSAASDPIAEYVEPTWPKEVQAAFRLVVRNYSVNAKVDIETAVNLIKPGIVASQAKAATVSA